MGLLDPIESEVSNTVGVEDSALAFIDSLKQQVAATSGDPAKVAALVAQLGARREALAAAIAANPEPPPEGSRRS